MNVFAIGSEKRIKELQELNDKIFASDNFSDIKKKINKGDFLIHFWESESIDDLSEFLNFEGINVLLNTVNTSLSEIKVFTGTYKINIIGFAGIPGFINRDKWELTSSTNDTIEGFSDLFKFLKVKPIKVKDRVGMVSPRVIAMIINEAYYTVMEGTAEKKDIDIAMKLGTNYPEGPFTWLEKIGIEHVYELLDAIFEDTKEERYKICPLLKQEYMNSMEA